jgi:hypothetical protein
MIIGKFNFTLPVFTCPDKPGIYIIYFRKIPSAREIDVDINIVFGEKGGN